MNYNKQTIESSGRSMIQLSDLIDFAKSRMSKYDGCRDFDFVHVTLIDSDKIALAFDHKDENSSGVKIIR